MLCSKGMWRCPDSLFPIPHQLSIGCEYTWIKYHTWVTQIHLISHCFPSPNETTLSKVGNPLCDGMDIMIEIKQTFSDRMALNPSMRSKCMSMVYLLSNNVIVKKRCANDHYRLGSAESSTNETIGIYSSARVVNHQQMIQNCWLTAKHVWYLSPDQSMGTCGALEVIKSSHPF